MRSGLADARRIILLVGLITLPFLLGFPVFAQGTAFTYNGQLSDNSNPATGGYDLRFVLYNAATNGNAIGAVTNLATGVTNGLFTATLDFGGAFDGSSRWLELAARTNGGGAFTVLNPRQPVLPVPYAVYAGYAATAVSANSANSIAAANINGILSLPQLPGAVLTNGGTFTGTLNVTGGNVVTNLANVYLFTNATAFFNGQWHHYTNSTTCGLQEVLDALNDCTLDNNADPHGGKIIFGRGIYRLTSPVSVTTTNITIIFEGEGVAASGILYDGPADADAISILSASVYGVPCYINFSMSHMFLGGNRDSTSTLLVLNNYFSKIDIRDSWFGYWPAMTGGGANHDGGLQPPNWGGGNYGQNLCGIYIEGEGSDNIAVIEDCDFLGLHVGVINASDHSVISDNMFLFCGAAGGTAWSADSSYYPRLSVEDYLNYFGGAIVIGHTVHSNQRYYNNYFYGGNVAYLCDEPNTDSKIVTMGDGFEAMANNVFLSNQSQLLQINPHGSIPGSQTLSSLTPSYGVYSLTDAMPTSLLTERLNTYDASYSGFHSFNFGSATIIGNGSGLTQLDAAQLTGTLSPAQLPAALQANLAANSGGLTLKLAVLAPGGVTNTLCFTNGILKAIQ